MDIFKNKSSIFCTRKPNWGYGVNISCFVTIICQNWIIKNGAMLFSELEIMAVKYWLEIPKHFFMVQLYNHVIMSNHVHGIIHITRTNDKRNFIDETRNIASLQHKYKSS